jgi:hypothetical protein
MERALIKGALSASTESRRKSSALAIIRSLILHRVQSCLDPMDLQRIPSHH